MIPGTAIPTTRPQVDDTLTPARPSQKVSDSLSDFQPGQRLVATIQSQLANGTYRAVIAQRDVTLALPFSAKPGDQFKLEVVDTRGRVAFALAEDTPDQAPKGSNLASSTTTLSAAGRVIGTLFAKPAPGSASGAAADPAPAALNRGQPLAQPPAENGAQLAPALQKAVTQSGLFFEAHLAAWISGKYPKAEILREPLASLRRPGPDGTPPRGEGTTPRPGQSAPASQGAGPASTAASPAAGQPGPAGGAATAQANAAAQRSAGQNLGPPAQLQLGTVSTTTEAGLRGAGSPLFNLPGEAAPVVHQQLNALATGVYAFQGQAWTNQRIEWSIVDEDGRSAGDDGDPARSWNSRLRLAMPALGEIDAVVSLRGNELEIRLVAPREDTRQALNAGATVLRNRFSALGLALDQMRVEAPAETDEPSDESPAA